MHRSLLCAIDIDIDDEDADGPFGCSCRFRFQFHSKFVTCKQGSEALIDDEDLAQ